MPQLSGRPIRVSRRIAADPSSTALLLAAPTAVDLWPGVKRVGEADGRVVVEVPPPSGERPALVSVRALPPRRTPTAYVTRFAWAGNGHPETSGRLMLVYAPTAEGTPVTHAVLELEVSGDPDGAPRYRERDLVAMAEGFLANLARAAETRNRAA